MFGLMFAFNLISSCVEVIKENHESVIPSENWGNRELMYQDRMSGMSEKQILKNVENGKYISTEEYSKPHRDSVTGKIIIENCKLFDEDCERYGVVKAYEWVERGKYNLSPEELKKERERVEKEIEDLCNTNSKFIVDKYREMIYNKDINM